MAELSLKLVPWFRELKKLNFAYFTLLLILLILLFIYFFDFSVIFSVLIFLHFYRIFIQKTVIFYEMTFCWTRFWLTSNFKSKYLCRHQVNNRPSIRRGAVCRRDANTQSAEFIISYTTWLVLITNFCYVCRFRYALPLFCH